MCRTGFCAGRGFSCRTGFATPSAMFCISTKASAEEVYGNGEFSIEVPAGNYENKYDRMKSCITLRSFILR
ncbi:MAG: hypothetical protein DRI57_31145 [Deltaproteobacteria bacterium]|nr:MAG: hypothetical protein DRI57_31145 [Deltaproteobacteria bacterium]